MAAFPQESTQPITGAQVLIEEHDTSKDLLESLLKDRVHAELHVQIGTLEQLHTAVGNYFSTVHQRVTIIYKKGFLERLVNFNAVPADFAVLCLSMNLVACQTSTSQESMPSKDYGGLKGLIGLLEASGCLTLESVQCRILCATYEFGHGMFPPASMSVAACSKAARLLGLCPRRQRLIPGDRDGLEQEEERGRSWWALANLERFLGMCSKDPRLCTQDAAMSDSLPTEDNSWLQNSARPSTATDMTIATAQDVTVGQFARESQVSHLIGRVIRHVFDPIANATFQAQQYSQLERALTSFIPLLVKEDQEFGKYCTALGMCSSALFVLYDYSKPADVSVKTSVEVMYLMEPLSAQITQLSSTLFSTGEDVNYGMFSPYVPLSLYQAAVVQLRLWKHTGDVRFWHGLCSLKRILGHFDKRWRVAGCYIRLLEGDDPVILPSPLEMRAQ